MPDRGRSRSDDGALAAKLAKPFSGSDEQMFGAD